MKHGGMCMQRDNLTAGLHSDQLQLDALDGHLRVLHHQLPSERLGDHTVGGVQVTPDLEPRQQTPLDDRRHVPLCSANLILKGLFRSIS